ncbi:predicted succinate-semialdehyde dehydrogenase [Pseudozyma hubeiensis SY62]|uniref:Predicted succinate-semialdehyde dehydrogenase n=1 Tax=Pseudozyma hubeiensis (strain SY62) TaxID=1305764 RepID=R9PCP4_PSEHS|nr:predicted succinate-semialdehyde dehydrogenase [Pseudozyma hubeiensis SY62]GAC99134.1 predicted succinate-semialdehyde dehydrogenase [Pseudozyma hubeiensis SY62]
MQASSPVSCVDGDEHRMCFSFGPKVALPRMCLSVVQHDNGAAAPSATSHETEQTCQPLCILIAFTGSTDVGARQMMVLDERWCMYRDFSLVEKRLKLRCQRHRWQIVARVCRYSLCRLAIVLRESPHWYEVLTSLSQYEPQSLGLHATKPSCTM